MGVIMKKFIPIVVLCALSSLQAISGVSHGEQQLAYLEKLAQERKAELPKLRQQLREQVQGSQAAQELKTKINQYEEFIPTALAEVRARRAAVLPASGKAVATKPVSLAQELKERVQHDFKLPAAAK